jgi:hypothetical protein
VVSPAFNLLCPSDCPEPGAGFWNLRKGCCDFRIMGTYEIALLATFWYALKTLPGLMQSIGYFFGFALASWVFDQYFRRD